MGNPTSDSISGWTTIFRVPSRLNDDAFPTEDIVYLLFILTLPIPDKCNEIENDYKNYNKDAIKIYVR